MNRSALKARLALTIALVGSGCDISFFLCEPASEAALATLPPTLAETGIEDPDVYAYAPRFELWSDGADKRRWFALPSGEAIETADPDDWIFPVGTRVWKEFARDGKKLETRFLQKLGPGDREWVSVSYVWSADESEAIAEPLGRLSAGGTSHNVPAAGECAGCHGGRRSWVLGISAIQLARPPGQDSDPDRVDLEDLASLGLVTVPLEESPELPGAALDRDALGYLHANCGHCHNSSRPPRDGRRCFEPKNELDFWLPTGALDSVAGTPSVKTALAVGAIARGQPEASDLLDRVDRRGFIYQMPPLGSEEIDVMAVDLLRRWIESL